MGLIPMLLQTLFITSSLHITDAAWLCWPSPLLPDTSAPPISIRLPRWRCPKNHQCARAFIPPMLVRARGPAAGAPPGLMHANQNSPGSRRMWGGGRGGLLRLPPRSAGAPRPRMPRHFSMSWIGQTAPERQIPSPVHTQPPHLFKYGSAERHRFSRLKTRGS